MAGRFLRCLSFLAIVVCTIGSLAQSAENFSGTDPRQFDAAAYGERIMLGPDWLFATGDDPAWAAPDFDDTGWKTVSTEKALFEFGIGNVSHVWYRMHVHLPPQARNLMVATRLVSGRYEIFANGVRIGGLGNISPKRSPVSRVF